LTAYLKAELESLEARPGMLVGIKYLGKGTSKTSGKTYNRYEVVVQDPLPVVDAAALAVEGNGETVTAILLPITRALKSACGTGSRVAEAGLICL
jgi:hypothetical protein